jgi:murein L,D-transpeptidase YafK
MFNIDSVKSKAPGLDFSRIGRNILSLVGLMMVVCPLEVAARDASVIRTEVVVTKHNQTLQLLKPGGSQKTYRICLGLDSAGPKRIEGDQKTPEGSYFVCYKNVSSRFHRFIGISYPGIEDAGIGLKNRLISTETHDSIVKRIEDGITPPWNTKLGGWIGIHGYPSEIDRSLWATLLFPKPHNWTDGCIAMWSFEIEELFSKVFIGTPVKILP